jgi:hypothetical protein
MVNNVDGFFCDKVTKSHKKYMSYKTTRHKFAKGKVKHGKFWSFRTYMINRWSKIFGRRIGLRKMKKMSEYDSPVNLKFVWSLNVDLPNVTSDVQYGLTYKNVFTNKATFYNTIVKFHGNVPYIPKYKMLNFKTCTDDTFDIEKVHNVAQELCEELLNCEITVPMMLKETTSSCGKYMCVILPHYLKNSILLGAVIYNVINSKLFVKQAKTKGTEWMLMDFIMPIMYEQKYLPNTLENYAGRYTKFRVHFAPFIKEDKLSVYVHSLLDIDVTEKKSTYNLYDTDEYITNSLFDPDLEEVHNKINMFFVMIEMLDKLFQDGYKYVFDQIINIVSHTVDSRVNFCSVTNIVSKINFTVMAFDFIVDENAKVWLLECNTNPVVQESLANIFYQELFHAMKTHSVTKKCDNYDYVHNDKIIIDPLQPKKYYLDSVK